MLVLSVAVSRIQIKRARYFDIASNLCLVI